MSWVPQQTCDTARPGIQVSRLSHPRGSPQRGWRADGLQAQGQEAPVPALALPYSPQSGTCRLWRDSQSGWVWKSEGRKELPSFPTPGAASSKHETVLGSRPQNHSALETPSKPVPKKQEGEAGLGRCRWREGGVKRLQEDRPEKFGGACMRTPPPRDAPFTYFGKTRAIGENVRRVVSPWGPDLLGCLFIPLRQFPCLRVDRAVTSATQT